MIIQLIDRAGHVVGTMTLPASTRVSELDALRSLGIARARMLR